MFPITQGAEIWNISSLDMYLAPHKISERALTILFMSKKNTCFLSILGMTFIDPYCNTGSFINEVLSYSKLSYFGTL